MKEIIAVPSEYRNASKYFLFNISCNVSYPNVEKVVKAPQKPIPTAYKTNSEMTLSM